MANLLRISFTICAIGGFESFDQVHPCMMPFVGRWASAKSSVDFFLCVYIFYLIQFQLKYMSGHQVKE
jgi:hypothetical protein